MMDLSGGGKPLVLASGSPRRKELLSKKGYTYEVCVPEVDEHVSGHPRDVVRVLAERKARAAAERIRHGVILASDTLVSLDGIPLGKPSDASDARHMLRALSGRTHEVYSGICALDACTGHCEVQAVCTGVRFRAISDAEIDAYIATGEPMDKAGAYAIQGGAGAFVAGLDGSFENVMGLPVDEVRDMLHRFGF